MFSFLQYVRENFEIANFWAPSFYILTKVVHSDVMISLMSIITAGSFRWLIANHYRPGEGSQVQLVVYNDVCIVMFDIGTIYKQNVNFVLVHVLSMSYMLWCANK